MFKNFKISPDERKLFAKSNSNDYDINNLKGQVKNIIAVENKNLDNNIRLINNLLMKLIKNCYKLIISDALINDNVKNFLNISKSTKKTIFIKNTFQKFKDVKAIRYHDENEFLNQVKKDIELNNFFLFGSDSFKPNKLSKQAVCTPFNRDIFSEEMKKAIEYFF